MAIRRIKPELYAAIEDLKEIFGEHAGRFEEEHPGTVVKVTFEVKTKLGSEKIKVGIAGPYNQQSLPGMTPPTDEKRQKWWDEEHGSN